MPISKKSSGNVDVAIWRAHIENIWANSAALLERVAAPHFHNISDVYSWAFELLALGQGSTDG